MAKSSKLSKMAANRLAVSATVTSSATVHGGEIAAALHAVLFPKGPAKPDLTVQLLDALSAALDRAAADVERADLAHASELLDDEAPRQRRDVAQAELSALLLQQRATMEALYGAQTARAYGLTEALPTQPAQLVVRARSVEKQLRENPITDKPLRKGLSLKASELADELDDHLGRLATALADVQREAREAQLTLEEKTQAAERWQTVYQGVTSAFYGLYLLAGRKDLAERIEPTARRRAGLPEPGDTPPPTPATDPKPASPPRPHPVATGSAPRAVPGAPISLGAAAAGSDTLPAEVCMFRQLHIEGFRGFQALHVAPLGRVNLIVGKNNSGKTALLDAVEMLVSDQPTPFLEGLIRRREISQRLAEEPSGSPTKLYRLALLASLFPGHQITPDARFVLRGSDPTELCIEVGIGRAEPPMTEAFLAWNQRSKPTKPGPASGIWYRRGGAEEKVMLPLTPQGGLVYLSSPRSVRGDTPLSFLGTDRPDVRDLSSLWDKIMLTEEEPLVIEALRLLDPRVERLAFRGEGLDRNIVVKRQGEKHPVLLGSLGDGMRHLLSLALNLVLARKGYLLIDEIDTGLHHSVLSQMWRLLIETARRLDIQVFATTHSLDCIRALGDVQEQIAVTEDDLMLHRLEAGLPSSVPYKPQELVDAIAFQTEVR